MFKPIENLINSLTPPQPISWQTLISLSIFSWAFSLFSYSLPNPSGVLAARLMNNCAFLFFIIGFFWFQNEKRWHIFGIKLKPILVGLLISIFLFKNFQNNSFALTIRHWPIISGIIAIVPDFFKQFKFIIPLPEKRKNLVTILLFYLLISCWVNFYFFLQNWLMNDTQNNYFNKNVDESMFVVRLIPHHVETVVQKTAQYKLPEDADKILQDIENLIQTNIQKQSSWETVEFWIQRLESEWVKSQMENLLNNQIKDSSWSVGIEVIPQRENNQADISEYQIILSVIWSGSREKIVTIQKKCQLKRVVSIAPLTDADSSTKIFAELTCEDTTMTRGES